MCMADSNRQTARQREKGGGVVRSLYAGEFESARNRRQDALREADAQLDRIARLLPEALAAGWKISEIARLTDVSRPTLYELRGRYTGSPRDLRLAVLQ